MIFRVFSWIVSIRKAILHVSFMMLHQAEPGSELWQATLKGWTIEATLFSMRKLLTKLPLAFLTLIAGIGLALPTAGDPNDAAKLPCLSNTPVTAVNEVEVEKIKSPWDVDHFVSSHPQGDLTRLWERLGIKTINVSEHQQLDPRNFRFLTECAACEADQFHHELDGEPGLEVIVRIRDKYLQATRYLIFKELDEPVGDWTLLGYVDEDFNKYRMSQHSVVTSGGRSLLIITGQRASGSGVAVYGSRIFLVKSDGVKEILSYVSDGQQAGLFDESTRSFSTDLLSCEIEGDFATIELRFSAKYFISDLSRDRAGLHLLTKTQRATFTRWLGEAQPKLDAGRSELTKRELDDVYYIDSLTNEEFLLHNFDALAKIASGSDSPRKDWLRRFLTACETTNERQRLQELLE